MVGNGDRRWLWFRMALLASCVVAPTFQLGSMKDDFSQPSLSFALLMTSGTALVMFLLLSLRTPTARSPELWKKPSWFANPFSFGQQPLQTFYDGALCLLAGSIGYLIAGLGIPHLRWAWELPGSFGLGVWIGVGACVRMFPKRFG